MRPIRQALGSTVINPALLTCAERIQYDGFITRQSALPADVQPLPDRTRGLHAGVGLGEGPG